MYDRLTIREPCMKLLGNARHHLSVGRRKSFFFTGVEILHITNQQLFRTVFCWCFVTSDNSSFQVFSYTADKEIRTDDLCLDVSRLNGPVTMLKCHHMRGNQLWEYDAEVPGLRGWGRLGFSQENSICPCAPGISRSRANSGVQNNAVAWLVFTYFHNIYLQRGGKVKLLTALGSSFLVAGTAMHLIKLKKHVRTIFLNFFF